MSLWIRGKLSMQNYFTLMILFTVLLVVVVTASYLMPSNREDTAFLVALLSVLSMGSSLKVLIEIQRRRNQY